MGGGSSKPSPPPARRASPPPQRSPSPPPPPPPLFTEPWRKIRWTNHENTIERLKNYNPSGEDQQLRVLLHGAAGAGKSSFINSIKTVLNGRMYRGALVASTGQTCFTKEYKTFKIQQGRGGGCSSVVFNDIMGMDQNDLGAHVDDIKLALKGHVKDRYRFNPASPLSENDPFYNQNPTNNDKVHVLVYIADANKVSVVSDSVVNKIKDIRAEASRLGIPQVAILTKIDEFSAETNRDLKNVYKDKSLKKQMEEISQTVGIPMNCIFPLKNYHEEIDLNEDINALILSILENIIDLGDDFITDNMM